MEPRESRKRQLSSTPAEARKRLLRIRLSAQEEQQIRQAIPSRLVSRVVREFLENITKNGGYTPPPESTTREHLYQLGKIGSNVNQVARAVNIAKKSGSPINLVALSIELSGIREELARLR